MTKEAKAQDNKRAEADKIVRYHMLGSAAVVFVPIPLLDIAVVGGIQLNMLRKLAKLYDVDFPEQRVNAILGSLTTISVARTAASLLGKIPGIGMIVTGLSGLTLAPASTYALAQVFIKHFESGGTFLTFDAERGKKEYEEELVAGKKAVEQNYAGIKP